jgi:hypothetical protein
MNRSVVARLGLLLITAIAAVQAPPTAAADAALQTLHVATPATPRRWSAAVGDWSLYLLPSSTYAGDGARVATLQRWADEDRFDAGQRLQRALVESLTKRQRTAVALEISRPPELKPSALARDLVPDPPPSGPIVDVALEQFGIWAASSANYYRPFIRVGWRLLDSRGRILAPTHVLYYSKTSFRDLPHARQLVASEDCRWSTFDAVADERARLWACLGEGLERLADEIAVSAALQTGSVLP